MELPKEEDYTKRSKLQEKIYKITEEIKSKESLLQYPRNDAEKEYHMVEIAKLKEELKRAKKDLSQNAAEKREKEVAFNEIKKSYKQRNSKFFRLARKLIRRTPKWKEIKKYDMSELDYLVDAAHGVNHKEGYMKKEKVRDYARQFVEEHYPEMSQREKDKKVQEMITNSFENVLYNKGILDMEIEHGKGGFSI